MLSVEQLHVDLRNTPFLDIRKLVVVYHDGEYSGICADSWTHLEAEVVCRSTGWHDVDFVYFRTCLLHQ